MKKKLPIKNVSLKDVRNRFLASQAFRGSIVSPSQTLEIPILHIKAKQILKQAYILYFPSRMPPLPFIAWSSCNHDKHQANIVPHMEDTMCDVGYLQGQQAAGILFRVECLKKILSSDAEYYLRAGPPTERLFLHCLVGRRPRQL